MPSIPDSNSNNIKLKITRHYTTKKGGAFSTFTFVKKKALITNPDGTVIFEKIDVEVPDFWEQSSIDVLASKYFRKKGVAQSKDEEDSETSIKQVASRLANAWQKWGDKGGYFASSEDSDAFRDEMAYMIVAQIGAPNSPQFFNTGLHEAYKIEQEANGESYLDPATDKIKYSQHRYERSAANACFILGIEDKLVGPGSIFTTIADEARLFQSGSGVGINWSNIRGKGEGLSGGGVSSGMLSFLKVADRAAGSIKSGGTTRRAAVMTILEVDHPEIEDFIWAKALEERKIEALVRAGYDPAWNAPDGAVSSAQYQNFNSSIMLSSDFMESVEANSDWNLREVKTRKITKTVKATSLWDSIAKAAWQCADPGIMFSDTINDWNTVIKDGLIRATNPCAEYIFLDDTACNLASLNLVNFWDIENGFDSVSFAHAVRLFEIMLEITVSMSHYPTEKVAKNSSYYRTTGLGYCNLGALLMRAGIAYDSDEGRAIMASLTAILHLGSYTTSAEMAAAVGPAGAYEPNKESLEKVLKNHVRAAVVNSPVNQVKVKGKLSNKLYNYKIRGKEITRNFEQLTTESMCIDYKALEKTRFRGLAEVLEKTAKICLKKVGEYGVRNMFTSCLAPTGTIGILMGVDTTGVEPAFALVVGKKLAGGGYMKIVNSSVHEALVSLKYTREEISRIVQYALGSSSLQNTTSVNATELLRRGLSSTDIKNIEKALDTAFSLDFAINSVTIEDSTLESLGIEKDVYEKKDFSFLKALNFSDEQISEANTVVCGTQTVEGAADLKLEHLPVFSCANYCGEGTQVIHWEGHVRACGAIAPFVSGGISKTVNMPYLTTWEEVKSVYELSRKVGSKNCAIYRDGSKGSQVLTAGGVEDSEKKEPTYVLPTNMDIPVGTSPEAFYGGVHPPRFSPPNPRYGPTWRLTVGSEELYLRVSEYPDGCPAEIFMDWGRQGSALKGMTTALSIAISHALQRGMPVAAIVKAFQGQVFEPRGVVTGHTNLKMADSVVDMLARVLGHYYLDRKDLVHIVDVNEGDLDKIKTSGGIARAIINKGSLKSPDGTKLSEEIEKRRIYDKSCNSCGSVRLIQTGTCLCCQDCGESLGCS